MLLSSFYFRLCVSIWHLCFFTSHSPKQVGQPSLFCSMLGGSFKYQRLSVLCLRLVIVAALAILVVVVAAVGLFIFCCRRGAKSKFSASVTSSKHVSHVVMNLLSSRIEALRISRVSECCEFCAGNAVGGRPSSSCCVGKARNCHQEPFPTAKWHKASLFLQK